MAAVACFGEILLRLGAPGRELLLQSGRLEVHVGGARPMSPRGSPGWAMTRG